MEEGAGIWEGSRVGMGEGVGRREDRAKQLKACEGRVRGAWRGGEGKGRGRGERGIRGGGGSYLFISDISFMV